jgi:hypothetical protein
MNSYPTGEIIDDMEMRTVVFDFLGQEDRKTWLAEYQAAYISLKSPSVSYGFDAYTSSDSDMSSFSGFVYFDARKTRFLSIIADWTRCRILCLTEQGYLAWVPDAARKGDLIYVFLGADVPFVVRPTGDGLYKLVGECYIHGFMYGEALKTGQVKEQQICLI